MFFHDVGQVKDFVNIVSRFEEKIELSDGKTIVDAKSLIGIFTLDLTEILQVKVYADFNGYDIGQTMGSFLLNDNSGREHRSG